MIFVSDASGRPAARTSTPLALFGALLFLAGCGTDRQAPTLAASPPAAAPQDPLSAFIAGAAPGQSSRPPAIHHLGRKRKVSTG